MQVKGRDKLEKITIVLLAATLAIVAFNTFQINQIMTSGGASTGSSQIISAGQSGSTTTNLVKGSTSNVDVIPKGTPEIYGAELGVSYDDISPSTPQKANSTIKTLATLDQQISLAGADLDRYIDIGSRISCEYCCEAQAVINSDGQPACGCAHSFSMRGLAKYLLKNHGTEYTNDEILEELGKWKTLFYPAQLTAKAGVLQEQGIELNYINLASNKYRGLEAGVSGEMVGAC